MARRKTANNSATWQSYNGEISPKKPLRNYTMSCTVSFSAILITDRDTPKKAKMDAISGLKAAYANRLHMSEDDITVTVNHIKDTTV